MPKKKKKNEKFQLASPASQSDPGHPSQIFSVLPSIFLLDKPKIRTEKKRCLGEVVQKKKPNSYNVCHKKQNERVQKRQIRNIGKK
jgi:hypothetical protein